MPLFYVVVDCLILYEKEPCAASFSPMLSSFMRIVQLMCNPQTSKLCRCLDVGAGLLLRYALCVVALVITTTDISLEIDWPIFVWCICSSSRMGSRVQGLVTHCLWSNMLPTWFVASFGVSKRKEESYRNNCRPFHFLVQEKHFLQQETNTRWERPVYNMKLHCALLL